MPHTSICITDLPALQTILFFCIGIDSPLYDYVLAYGHPAL